MIAHAKQQKHNQRERARKSVRASEKEQCTKKKDRLVSIFFCAIQADVGDSKSKKKTCDEKSAIKRSNETKKKAALASVEHEKEKHALYIQQAMRCFRKTKILNFTDLFNHIFFPIHEKNKKRRDTL